jgi:Tol biopolymer transport system component
MSYRSQAGVVVGLVGALACFGSAVPLAEASFPGKNGLLAVSRFDPLIWDTTIWLVDPRSGRARELTRMPRRCRGPGPTWEDGDPSFSPSGRLIVYEHWDDCAPRTPNGTYVIGADGRGRRRLPVNPLASNPAFSPSGRLLAFNALGSVFIRDLKRPPPARELGDARRFPREWSAPSWGVSGRLALAVGGTTAERGHIATVSPNGSGLRLVTRSARDQQPDWSPRGDRIVFSRIDDPRLSFPDKSDILVAPARADRHQRPMRLTHTRDAFSPVWSPDGRELAFTRAFTREPGFGNRRLVIMRARDGEGQRLLVNRLSPLSRISWQPRPRR